MNYHNITYPDQNNGDGLRVVLWLSGCHHQCYDCQNPQTWDPYSGINFDESAKKEIFDQLDKDYISGITLSGGDPLHTNNLREVSSLIDEIRVLFPQKTIWLYTGYYFKNTFFHSYRDDLFYASILNKQRKKRKQIMSKCDVIVDGPYFNQLRDTSLKWRGSSNQSVIDVKKTLENIEMGKDEIVLWTN